MLTGSVGLIKSNGIREQRGHAGGCRRVAASPQAGPGCSGVAGRVRGPTSSSQLKGTAAVGLGVDPRDGGGSLGLCPDPAAVVGKRESSPSCYLCEDTVVSSPLPEPRGHPTASSTLVRIPLGSEAWPRSFSSLPYRACLTHWGTASLQHIYEALTPGNSFPSPGCCCFSHHSTRQARGGRDAHRDPRGDGQ